MAPNLNTLKALLLNQPESQAVRIVAPYPFEHRFYCKASEAGYTPAEVLHQRFPFRTLAQWQQHVQDGRILHHGAPITDAQISVHEGDELCHVNPAVREPSVPDEVRVLHQTDHWIAVFKPAPMPMHPGGRYNKNTLTTILQDMGLGELFLVHRLDAVTSGLVLLAKNATWASKLTQAFQQKTVHKMYVALVSGRPKMSQWECDFPIRRKEGFVFECGAHLEGAKPAHTRFEVLEQRDASTCLVACYPSTGRTHQLRLHLAASGHPIVDDEVYNGAQATRQDRSISLLHAALRIPELGIDVEVG